jgi:hypothetical protein
VAIGAVALLAGCASQDAAAPAATAQAQSAPAKADDFLVVDCLLPGQVRKLGQQFTYLAPRRAIKTSARDCEIRGGEYVAYDRANYATALKVWLPQAEQGDAAAQTYVGEIFEKGLGVAPDYSAAAVWYTRAAQSGYSRAAINLGSLYEQGLGVPRDPQQALNWYRRAAGLSQLTFEIVPSKSTAELQDLRNQITSLRGQLQDKEVQLEQSQREAEPLRKSLDERSKEADALRQEVETLKAQPSQAPPASAKSPPSQAPQSPGKSSPSSAEAPATNRRLEEAQALLAAKEREVAALRASVNRLAGSRDQGGRELANLRDALARSEAEWMLLKAGFQPVKQEMAQGGPRIDLKQVQLVEPELLAATRDIQVRKVSAPSGARSWIVVGRVVSASGLKSLLVNERRQPPEKETAFNIQLSESDRLLNIVATDRQDRRSMMEWRLPAAVGREGSEQGEASAVRLTSVQRLQLAASLGSYHALVIGNNNYRQVPALRTAVSDAQEVASVLREQYRFQVRLLTDATRYDILSALNELRSAMTKNDNLLIYYAGHGNIDDKTGRGYWLPVDAGPRGDTANWIANEDITSILDATPARQLLLVADSCYSGTLTRSALGQLQAGKSQDQVLELVEQMAQKRSRIAMTSGAVGPVLDGGAGGHSLFAEAFLRALRANDGVLLGRDVFRQIQLQAADMADRLPLSPEPQYGPIKPGHEAGEFVFLRPAS